MNNNVNNNQSKDENDTNRNYMKDRTHLASFENIFLKTKGDVPGWRETIKDDLSDCVKVLDIGNKLAYMLMNIFLVHLYEIKADLPSTKDELEALFVNCFKVVCQEPIHRGTSDRKTVVLKNNIMNFMYSSSYHSIIQGKILRYDGLTQCIHKLSIKYVTNLLNIIMLYYPKHVYNYVKVELHDTIASFYHTYSQGDDTKSKQKCTNKLISLIFLFVIVYVDLAPHQYTKII